MASHANHVSGKVIIVTGAGGGFGRLVSQKTAAMGGSVVAVDVNEGAVGETVDLVTAAGGKAAAVVGDVAQKADLDRAAAAAVQRFGAIDVLVNNAGTMPLAFFADHARAWEAWDRAIDINLKGIVHGIAAVYRGVAGAGVYSATKAAVGVISDALRVEAQGKIKVTTVRPTGVPGTGLGASVINYESMIGITGQKTARFNEHLGQWLGGTLPKDALDSNHVAYWTLSPGDLADQIVAVIDTPWGVNISDITVRATGEDYVL